MFKEKIVEGLRAKSEIKRFGLSNEAIDRIASAREKTVTEESQVETVLTDAETMRLIAEELMKHRDQEITKRTEAQSAFEDYKAKHPEGSGDGAGSGTGDGGKGTPMTAEAIAKLVKEAAEAAVKPVQDAFNAYKTQNSAKEAVVNAKNAFYANKWTGKFKEEADDAWDRAHELNEAKGGSMTEQELSAKATEYFNKAVQRKGTDTTKPFEEGDDTNKTFDFSDQAKHLREKGLLPKEENK